MDDIADNNSHSIVDSSEPTKEKPEGQDFRVLLVDHDCELREFIENECELKFQRGCAFYEFTHDVEKISEHQQVILVKQVSSS